MKRISLVSIFFVSIAVWAAPKPKPPLELMHRFLGSITSLRPYMVSEEKFKDKKNEPEISRELKNMSDVSKKLKHSPALDTPTFRPSADVISSHIQDTERVFRSGNKAYARWMLNSTLSMCMSCHTQVATSSRQLLPTSVEDTYTSEFDQAEFLFTIRDFDKAHNLYRKVIEGFPKNMLPADKIEAALEREVAYFARIKRDAEAGAKALEAYKSNEHLAQYMKENLDQWIKQFKDWKPEEIFEMKNPTDDQIKAFIKKHLENAEPNPSVANPNVVNYLYTSGILYEYLSRNPDSKLAPDILYWLAVCDRGVNSNFFFSLADIYLKDCITKYPSDPMAKKCLKGYEDDTIASFSGSGGTHLPADVKGELKRLHKLVDKNQK